MNGPLNPKEFEYLMRLAAQNAARYTFAPPFAPQKQPQWTARQRLEGEAADRAMIRLLQQELTL